MRGLGQSEGVIDGRNRGRICFLESWGFLEYVLECFGFLENIICIFDINQFRIDFV